MERLLSLSDKILDSIFRGERGESRIASLGERSWMDQRRNVDILFLRIVAGIG